MKGLMQNWPLTLDKILDHANAWHGSREVVSRSEAGSLTRTDYSQVWVRAKRLSNALKRRNVGLGDRVATLAWNTARHLETWYASMGIGAICHTLNPRLHIDQLLYIINHAEDKILLTDPMFAPIVLEYRARLRTVEHVIVMTDKTGMKGVSLPGAACYETLIEENDATCTWGQFDENTAAGLCYTSGTTGDPKGVLYSHRSNFLHTLVVGGADVLGVSARDTVLPMVPMFHANAWGLAFSCPAVGAKMVLAGPKLDGASVYELLETEGVTFAAAVPTVWQSLLSHLRDTHGRFATLKRAIFGGASPPLSLLRVLRDDYGVTLGHGWGMTEMSPLGTFTSPTLGIERKNLEQQLKYVAKQGRPPLCVELTLTDVHGAALPHDGLSNGTVKVKGPCVAHSYFKSQAPTVVDADGFLDTGDIATIDEHGYLQITDRAKDVIKSGGEWISSVAIENVTLANPKVHRCAVLGFAHPKWDERPVLIVQLSEGQTASKLELLEFLQEKIAKWWMPDDVCFVGEIPVGATGKIDKKRIREQMRNYVLTVQDR